MSSILGNLASQVLGGLGNSGDAPAGSPLLAVISQLLSSQGGLSGLVDQFQKAGLGETMNSWISTGNNLPISTEQLSQVLGGARLQDLAQQAGMSSTDLGEGLSRLLPQAVDRLTPQGELPADSGGGIEDLLAGLAGKLGQS